MVCELYNVSILDFATLFVSSVKTTQTRWRVSNGDYKKNIQFIKKKNTI